jgi:hypothetical protein
LVILAPDESAAERRFLILWYQSYDDVANFKTSVTPWDEHSTATADGYEKSLGREP